MTSQAAATHVADPGQADSEDELFYLGAAANSADQARAKRLKARDERNTSENPQQTQPWMLAAASAAGLVPAVMEVAAKGQEGEMHPWLKNYRWSTCSQCKAEKYEVNFQPCSVCKLNLCDSCSQQRAGVCFKCTRATYLASTGVGSGFSVQAKTWLSEKIAKQQDLTKDGLPVRFYSAKGNDCRVCSTDYKANFCHYCGRRTRMALQSDLQWMPISWSSLFF